MVSYEMRAWQLFARRQGRKPIVGVEKGNERRTISAWMRTRTSKNLLKRYGQMEDGAMIAEDEAASELKGQTHM
jgi:hypothetical protein